MGGNYALGFTINVNLVVFKLTVYIEIQQPKKKYIYISLEDIGN